MNLVYYILLIAGLFVYTNLAAQGETFCQVYYHPDWTTTGTELVVNPSFETGRSPWYTMDEEGWSRIYSQDAFWGSCGSWYANINTNKNRKTCNRNAGVFQLVQVNQTVARPLVLSAWSIGFQINGSYGADYSLYADVRHTDNTYSYGFIAPFDLDVMLWQVKSLVIITEKPILSLYIYGLFRGGFTGNVYFDNFSVQEATSSIAGNLITNPSFNGGSSSNCAAPINGWTNINSLNPYLTCPQPDLWMVNSKPGFIATPGEIGLSGAQQRIHLNQITPRSISFGVHARWTRTTQSGTHVVVNDARLVITYTDSTTEIASVAITDTTTVRRYTIDFTPTKTIQYVDIQLRFDCAGYSGTMIHWDDAWLVQV